MARTTSSFRFETVSDGIIDWFNGPEWDAEAEAEFKVAARQLEEIMKSDAPWADRSGAARAGLNASVENQAGVVSIILAHGVEWGKWLELIQNGRFAIVGPTLERHARRITYNAIRRIRYARKGKN
ncbi:hypothetical protein PBI_TRISCUIT_42 [Microbacterium phage Triscuit]|nr:hypothetical protein PBI_TRISCUIT_42 [Microbacterium phage Triscuit]